MRKRIRREADFDRGKCNGNTGKKDWKSLHHRCGDSYQERCGG